MQHSILGAVFFDEGWRGCVDIKASLQSQVIVTLGILGIESSNVARAVTFVQVLIPRFCLLFSMGWMDWP